MLDDATTAPIGSIHGERAPLTTAFEPQRQPILITTFGRTGSMLLMRLLSSHPGHPVLQAAPLRAAHRELLDRRAADLRRIRSATCAESRPRAPSPIRPGGSAGTPGCRRRCATRACRSGWEATPWRRSPRSASSGSTRPTSASPPTPAPATSGCLPRSRTCVCHRSRPSSIRTAGSCSSCGTSATWCARCSRSTASAACPGSGAARRTPTPTTSSGSAAGRSRWHGPGSGAATAPIWSATRTWCSTPSRRSRGCSNTSAWTRAQRRPPAWWTASPRSFRSWASTGPPTRPQNSVGRWRRDLDPDVTAACERSFGAALDLFGYER